MRLQYVMLICVLYVGKDSKASTEAATAEYTNNHFITPGRW